MIEETLDKLTINYLTEEQYKAAKENNEINENELYCTPDDESNSSNTYSTEEQVIGTWMGKPLYRKTFKINVGTTKLYQLDISSLNADELMFDDSHSFFKQSVYTLQFGFYSGDYDWSRMYRDSSSKIIFLQFGDYYTMEKNATVTLEYTKTTD